MDFHDLIAAFSPPLPDPDAVGTVLFVSDGAAGRFELVLGHLYSLDAP